MFRRRKGAWKRRLLRAVVIFTLLGLGLLVYSTRFHPEREDIPGQRAALAQRTSATTLERIEPGVLVADLRNLSDPKMAGRKVGTPGGARARAYLLERYRRLGLAPVGASFEHPFTFTPHRGIAFWRGSFWEKKPPITGVNLVGQIRGSVGPDKFIVVSAHYDHLGVRRGQLHPGADDNASGVAALLATARWFKAHPPRHSLLIVAFDGEEAGLRGAEAFVATPPVPKDAILANVNFDMLSRNPAGELFVSGLYANPQFKPLLDGLRERSPVTLLYGHDHPRPFWDMDDWTQLSDQGPFADAGIPFLYFGVEDHPDYHRPTDTFERVDQAFYQRVADLVVGAVAALDAQPSASLRPARSD